MRVGHGETGPGRPCLARPVVYSKHRSKPDPACEILISLTAGQARFARLNLAGRLPGLSHDTLRSFSCLSSSYGSSSSKNRGPKLLVSPHPVVPLGSRPLPVSGVRSRVCRALIPTFGYRWYAWVVQFLDRAYLETWQLSRTVILILVFGNTLKHWRHES